MPRPKASGQSTSIKNVQKGSQLKPNSPMYRWGSSCMQFEQYFNAFAKQQLTCSSSARCHCATSSSGILFIICMNISLEISPPPVSDDDCSCVIRYLLEQRASPRAKRRSRAGVDAHAMIKRKRSKRINQSNKPKRKAVIHSFIHSEQVEITIHGSKPSYFWIKAFSFLFFQLTSGFCWCWCW